jgi:PleD family two-component response regulator
MADINRIAATPVQKVVIVNGSADVLGMLEAVLDAGRYDMVFVESANHAYSNIKKLQPNLVILCTSIEDVAGFQLLTMLKLDAETRDVPVLTYTTECDGQESDDEVAQIPDDDEESRPVAPALRMN